MAEQEQLAVMREALERIATKGTHHDTHPTMPPGGRDTMWWYSYIQGADEVVRRIAKEALAATSPAVVPDDDAAGATS